MKSTRSGDDDIERGIYQCVKYGAVLEAMSKNDGKKKEISTLLVIENEMNSTLKASAKKLDVNWVLK